MPSPTFTVRRLGLGDVAAMRRMNALFGEVFADAEAYANDPPDDGYLETLLAKEHVVALAALADGDMVGGLVAYELEKFERRRSEFYVYDLAVDPAHRRRGIATALIGELRKTAARRGAEVLFVQADDPAVALYTQLGTREDVMHFDIPVDPRRG